MLKSKIFFLNFILLLIVIFSGCGRNNLENYDKKINSIKCTSTPDSVITYINAAIDTMQKHSLFKDKINWNELRQIAIDKSGGMRNYSDTYPILESALGSIGDRHSFLKTPRQHFKWKHNSEKATIPKPVGRMLKNNIAFIQIDEFFSGDSINCKVFAQNLQTTIKELDSSHPKGWIVNLSYNRGGNMWPMLVGIGPLLNDGDWGGVLFSDGKYERWSYLNGEAKMKDEVVLKIDNPYKIQKLNTPIAVLIGNKTASSGEAILVSFLGRANVRTFGSKTAGLSTANEEYTLMDGAQLILTIAILTDAKGRKYGKSIEPDTDLTERWYFLPGFKQFVMMNEAKEWIIEEHKSRVLSDNAKRN